MRNIKLFIEYEGTQYVGWQWQKNGKSIQEVLSKAIERVAQEKVKLYGASRTDAGVHALGQVANFHTTSNVLLERLPMAINFYLPQDITVKSAEEVPSSFHAQFDAKSKVYQYTVLNTWIRSSLNRNFCYLYGFPLDIKKMISAASYIVGTHDFTSFATQSFCEKNRIRTVKELDIKKEGEYIYFTIEGNGFLYNMVRAIVGTLLEVGRCKRSAVSIKDILSARNRNLAGPSAPAKGLCLVKIKYDN